MGNIADHDLEALRLFEEERLSYGEIREILGLTTDKQVNHAIDRARQGQEERKPSIREEGEGYYVTSGKREIFITKTILRVLKDLYCSTPPLTVNETCRKLDMPRRDFYLIKSAFGITHDDVPFIDEDLKEYGPEELAEMSLEKQKDQYFVQLEQKRYDMLFNELKEYRKQDYLIEKISGLLEDFLKDFSKTYKGPTDFKVDTDGELMLEVPIVDLHVNMLARLTESDSEYNLEVAKERFRRVIEDVYIRAQNLNVKKVLLPVGNDLLHSDNLDGSTTKGTRLDVDTVQQEQYLATVALLIEGIDRLSQLAPVEVLLVPGNHDKLMSFCALHHLAAWYRDSDRVDVNPDSKARKYVEFGVNLIGFTHGDKEKKRLFGNMQIEAPEAWGRTKFREWHTGHLHHERSADEFGVTVRRLPTVNGTDRYHYEAGYVGAIMRNQSFVWHKDMGLREIWYTNI